MDYQVKFVGFNIFGVYQNTRICRVTKVYARQCYRKFRRTREHFREFDCGTEVTLASAAIQTPLAPVGCLIKVKRSSLQIASFVPLYIILSLRCGRKKETRIRLREILGNNRRQS
jgi:hypothetical protein